MSLIHTASIAATTAPAELWPLVARQCAQWLAQAGLSARDAVLLLPFAELLPPCRRAWAVQGGWVPRVETVRTMAATLGPPEVASAEAPSGDRAVDQLLAERWLASLPGLRDWRRRDPAAHAQAIADVVDAAHALMRAAAAQAPADRAAWWDAAAVAMPLPEGPGALDAALGRLALQWAQLSSPPSTDLLFSARPSAWLVLQAGGADPLTEALMNDAAAQGIPCLRLCADNALADPFEPMAAATPTLLTVASLEDEAWAAAAATIEATNRGETPVALIAQDRLLVRRIRALLDRRGLRVADESGWALSTTRAASHLMALLKATHPAAGPDAWLDGLKACRGGADGPWLDRLERHWRRSGTAIPADRAEDALFVRWQSQLAQWQAFAAPQRQTLQRWLASLRDLAADQLPAEFWTQDPVAERVRSALHLDEASVRGDVDGLQLTLDEFTGWVGQVLEQATFIAPVPVEAAQVVITPLARAILRPFATVVLPGADERQLGAPLPGPALLPDALLRALGLDDAQARQQRAALGFTQLLRHPALLLLRRRADGSEPVGASRWVDRLQAARTAQQRPALVEAHAPWHGESREAMPVEPPAAIAADALPATVSASAVEALRACPYRFFARSVLRLSEADELEADPGKRDFGSLLHEALHRFHETRDRMAALEVEVPRLVALARAVALESGLDGPAMLPFDAGLQDFAKRYLVWLQARDVEGWQYQRGEFDMTASLAGLDDLQLKGRIDRLDQGRGGTTQLIDYKTGGKAGLDAKVREPLEDTQLAFYAAQVLLAGEAPKALSAIYLALDDRKGILAVEHKDVADSAQALITGLAQDWHRLRAGAPMHALGEGPVCDTCEARGLCRRDHWADLSVASTGDEA